MSFQPESYFKLSLSLPIALLAAQSPYPKVTDERLERPDAGDWLRLGS